MAKTKAGYNEAGTMADTPDGSASEIYVTYSQCTGGEGESLESTPNSRSGAGVMGGPASGDPQVVGTSTTNQSK